MKHLQELYQNSVKVHGLEIILPSFCVYQENRICPWKFKLQARFVACKRVPVNLFWNLLLRYPQGNFPCHNRS